MTNFMGTERAQCALSSVSLRKGKRKAITIIGQIYKISKMSNKKNFMPSGPFRRKEY